LYSTLKAAKAHRENPPQAPEPEIEINKNKLDPEVLYNFHDINALNALMQESRGFAVGQTTRMITSEIKSAFTLLQPLTRNLLVPLKRVEGV